MRMPKRLAGGVLAGAALLAAPAAGHHSTAMFDMEAEVSITGVVKEWQYTNPHSWLIVTVTNEDGSTTDWSFEAEAPSTMMRARIGRNSFPVGEEVTVLGSPMRDGRPAASWIQTTMSDGRVLSLRPGG